MCVSLAGLRGLGQLQTERHAWGLRDPLRQSRSQRLSRREVRHVLWFSSLSWSARFVSHCWRFRTETPLQTCWIPRSPWRRQRSRGCTARQPRLFHASTCSTPSSCSTTTPCCPLPPPRRTTVLVRTNSRVVGLQVSSFFFLVYVTYQSHSQ